jgi:hypothetical protein
LHSSSAHVEASRDSSRSTRGTNPRHSSEVSSKPPRRGFHVRRQGDRIVKFVLDRESGTAMFFRVQGDELVLVVRVDDEPNAGVDVEAEIARAHALGQGQFTEPVMPGMGVESVERPADTAADMHCCVNGSFYRCPSVGAVDQCAGAFTRCLSDCGFGCADRCLETNPPDPSACTRDSSRDGEC